MLAFFRWVKGKYSNLSAVGRSSLRVVVFPLAFLAALIAEDAVRLALGIDPKTLDEWKTALLVALGAGLGVAFSELLFSGK